MEYLESNKIKARELLGSFPLNACEICNLIQFEFLGKTTFLDLCAFELLLEQILKNKIKRATCKHVGSIYYEVQLLK